MSKRVVITGLGLISPAGKDKESFFRSLCQGGRIGGDKLEIEGFKASNYINAGLARKMSKPAQFGVAAAKLAIEDAAINMEECGADTGIIMGNAFGSGSGMDKYLTNIEQLGGSKASPVAFVNIMHQEATAQICINMGIRAFHLTLATMGSGIAGAAMGADMIKAGRADIVLTGGAEEISPTVWDLSKAAGYICKEKDGSDSIPFGEKSTGCRHGLGAGIIILEELEHALQRGAHIYGEIVGAASSADTLGVMDINPQGDGLSRAIDKALSQSGLKAGDIDCIFAAASGYRAADSAECEAIKRLGINENTPVTAVKSIIGECFGATGAFQLGAALMSMEYSMVPPIAGLTPEENEIHRYCVCGAEKHFVRKPQNILINSLYPGGENSALILRSWSTEA